MFNMDDTLQKLNDLGIRTKIESDGTILVQTTGSTSGPSVYTEEEIDEYEFKEDYQ